MIRLNKFLSMAGVSSRRKADEMIQEARVSVNGTVVADLGHKIDPAKDTVFADGKQVAVLREPVYILFNKPKDCITTLRDERGRATVMDYVKVKERVFPVGRLDRNTTGVLLLSNDGEFANRMMHPRHSVEKAYRVTLSSPLAPEHARRLAEGIRLADGKTGPAELSYLAGGKKKVVGIVIREGRNRQVHRMFEALGYEVEKLDRVAYAGITYEGLKRGEWRHLKKSEVEHLREL
ncbi:MAG TPA: pseudouridine synthase [Bacteroidota bacterium]|nr:pseudouridine synthase [Bacteroidota bacterium]